MLQEHTVGVVVDHRMDGHRAGNAAQRIVALAFLRAEERQHAIPQVLAYCPIPLCHQVRDAAVRFFQHAFKIAGVHLARKLGGILHIDEHGRHQPNFVGCGPGGGGGRLQLADAIQQRQDDQREGVVAEHGPLFAHFLKRSL